MITNVDTCLLPQVLYYCPGLREGIKKLYNFSKRKDKPKDETDKSDEVGTNFHSIYISFRGLLYNIVYSNFVSVIGPHFLLYCILFLHPHSQQSEVISEDAPPQIELLGSFNNLITSVEQLQSDFLLSPDSFSEGELATPPRKLLHTLR